MAAAVFCRAYWLISNRLWLLKCWQKCSQKGFSFVSCFAFSVELSFSSFRFFLFSHSTSLSLAYLCVCVLQFTQLTKCINGSESPLSLWCCYYLYACALMPQRGKNMSAYILCTFIIGCNSLIHWRLNDWTIYSLYFGPISILFLAIQNIKNVFKRRGKNETHPVLVIHLHMKHGQRQRQLLLGHSMNWRLYGIRSICSNLNLFQLQPITHSSVQ